MKITCIDKEIKKILETGYFHIPRFQRPYSWEKDHVTEFWHDTVIESELDYFIGSFVLYKKNDDLYGIVDGQQRITTITLILCALRDFYLLNKLEDQAKGVHRLVEKIDLNNKKNFILQTETSYPYFQEYIQKYGEPETEVELGAEEQNLERAFKQIQNYIRVEISTIEKDKQIPEEQKKKHIESALNNIRNRILKLKVIYIELDDEDDAYTVFETLNTRGKELDVADLVKNYLTKNIKSKNNQVDIPRDKWKTIRENIDSSSADIDLDAFMLHVWLSKYDYTTKKSLFKKLKSTIKLKNSNEFLNGLVKDSETYISIFDSELRKWSKNEVEIKDSIKALSSFGVTQQTPMVLSIMREYNASNLKYKYAKEGLNAIEKFHYVFTAITSQRSSGGIASMYSTYGRKLAACNSDQDQLTVIRELQLKMREKLPTYDEFLANFKSLKYTNKFTKNKKTIQYTLKQIDKHFNSNGVPIDYDLMTIEHILAQNPKMKATNHDLFVGSIGNLVYIDSKTNGDLENKDFLAKKPILLKASIFIDDVLKDATEWTESEISNRTEKLAEFAYNRVFKI
jgi:uncharacterized protein with ParB-like and HNH nuclease domain